MYLNTISDKKRKAFGSVHFCNTNFCVTKMNATELFYAISKPLVLWYLLMKMYILFSQ